MNWFLYLNYRIYSIYKGRDSDPWIYSCNGSVLIVFLNLLVLNLVLEYFFKVNMSGLIPISYKIIVGGFLILGMLLNYLLLYRKDKYLEVFNQISDTPKKRIVGTLYIIVSIVLAIGLAFYIKNKKFPSAASNASINIRDYRMVKYM